MHCRSSHNEEFTSCEPEHQLTCKVYIQFQLLYHCAKLVSNIFITFPNRRWIKFLLKSRLNVAQVASAKKATVQHLFDSNNNIFFFLRSNRL